MAQGGAWAPAVSVCQNRRAGVAEAWGLATNIVCGPRNYALPNPQPLKFMLLLRFWSLCFEKKSTKYICFAKTTKK